MTENKEEIEKVVKLIYMHFKKRQVENMFLVNVVKYIKKNISIIISE